MFTRIQTAVGLSLFLTLVTSIPAFAKGGFSFITITGATLKNEVRSTDPALTTDFFAFSIFYENKVESPANPGVGYEITRYYVKGNREVPFDRLHYFPESGFVYYDGIVNGSSEYDGEWYPANPEVKTAFESILGTAATTPQTIQPGEFLAGSQLLVLPIIFTVSLIIVLLFAHRIRRLSPR